jgi:hypothetical protein
VALAAVIAATAAVPAAAEVAAAVPCSSWGSPKPPQVQCQCVAAAPPPAHGLTALGQSCMALTMAAVGAVATCLATTPNPSFACCNTVAGASPTHGPTALGHCVHSMIVFWKLQLWQPRCGLWLAP